MDDIPKYIDRGRSYAQETQGEIEIVVYMVISLADYISHGLSTLIIQVKSRHSTIWD